jgi:hypothetical protein
MWLCVWCQRAPVVQVVVQKIILQDHHTVLHVLLVLLGNLALHAILILVRHLLVIYLMLFLMNAIVSSASSQDQHEPMFSVGSCVFPAESIYYNGVFQRRLHENGPHRVSIQSDAFAEFIPSAGNKLIPEAAGLQHYLPPTVALTEFSLSSVREATLTPLRTCHSFDHAIFDSIELPESGLKASTVVQIGKVFNDQIQKLSPSCPQNLATVVNSSPDAIMRLAHGGTTTIGVGSIFEDPAFKSPMILLEPVFAEIPKTSFFQKLLGLSWVSICKLLISMFPY